MNFQQFASIKLLLIRHGQARSSDGSYDTETPLSVLGKRQAERVAATLSTAPPTTIYTSPFTRAVETAMPLCQTLNLKPVVDSRLAEFEFGPATLESLDERPDLLLWQSTHRATEYGESLGEFMVRVADCCEEIVASHQNECIALFAHAGTLDAMIRWVVGLTADTVWQHEFHLANGSITEIEYWPQGQTTGGSPQYASIIRIGDVSHLGDWITVV